MNVVLITNQSSFCGISPTKQHVWRFNGGTHYENTSRFAMQHCRYCKAKRNVPIDQRTNKPTISYVDNDDFTMVVK